MYALGSSPQLTFNLKNEVFVLLEISCFSLFPKSVQDHIRSVF